MLTKSSCFPTALSRDLAECFVWFGENEQNHFLFFMVFKFVQLRLLPGIARNQSYIQNHHSGRPGPDEDDFENISTLFFEIPKRIHSSTITFKKQIRAFDNNINFLIIKSSGPAGTKKARKAFAERYRTSKSLVI